MYGKLQGGSQRQQPCEIGIQRVPQTRKGKEKSVASGWDAEHPDTMEKSKDKGEMPGVVTLNEADGSIPICHIPSLAIEQNTG